MTKNDYPQDLIYWIEIVFINLSIITGKIMTYLGFENILQSDNNSKINL